MKAILGVVRDDGVRLTIEVDVGISIHAYDFASAIEKYGASKDALEKYPQLHRCLGAALGEACSAICLEVPDGQ